MTILRTRNKDSENVARVIDALRGKWTFNILCEMRRGPVRLGQLRRSIPAASKKGLTSSLRRLERTGLIVRRDLTKSILHVEYELYDQKRESVATLLNILADWASSLQDHAIGEAQKA